MRTAWGWLVFAVVACVTIRILAWTVEPFLPLLVVLAMVLGVLIVLVGGHRQ